jgi:hypothetical protein
VICVVDDVPAGGAWSCTPQVPLHEGTNTLTATSVGPSGLSSPPSNSVSTVVDTLAPMPPELAQTPSPSANTMPTFTGTAEPGSTVNIYDGGPSIGAIPVATCIAHTVQATSTDAAGNVSMPSNTDTFVIDTTQPAPPTLQPLPTPLGATTGYTDNTQPTFSGTGVPGDTVTVQSTLPAPGGGPLCTAVVLADGTWSCMSTVMLSGDPATSYSFNANQTSPAGVISGPSNTEQETISTAAPQIPTLRRPSRSLEPGRPAPPWWSPTRPARSFALQRFSRMVLGAAPPSRCPRETPR